MKILKCREENTFEDKFYEIPCKCSGQEGECAHYRSRETTHDGAPDWDEWCDLGHSIGGRERCPHDTTTDCVVYQKDYFARAGRGMMV